MSAQLEGMREAPSCFGVGRITWNPKGHRVKTLNAIASDVMNEIERFIGAEATVFGFTPDGALGADHGALVLELTREAATTRIGFQFGARDLERGAIRHGFDAGRWREASMQWSSAGIWLANAEEALVLLCGLGRLLEVREARFVHGNPDRLCGAEEARQGEEQAARFQLCSYAGEPKWFSPPFVGLACVEVLRQWTFFTEAEMDVRFFTPPEATWIDHAAMVIEVRRGSRRTCVGAHFGASFDNGKVYRKMLDPTNWKGSSEDWRSSGLYLLTWAEAWAFLCAIGQRLNIRSVRMCYGEGEASYLVRMSEGLDAR